MSENLEHIASFKYPEICDTLCEALQNGGIDFYLEEESAPRDPLFPEVFGSTNVYVSEENYEAAIEIKNKLDNTEE